MPETTGLSPDVARVLSALARALVSAARNVALYPPAHPAVTAALTQLAPSFKTAASAGILNIGATPDTLMAGDVAPENPDALVREAAALLHDHGILSMSWEGEVRPEVFGAFVRLLTTDPTSLWDAGGPEVVWQGQGHGSIRIVQIDYRLVLEDDRPSKARHRRDDLWRSIVSSMASGQVSFDELAQKRLLEIAEDAEDVRDLAREITAPKCTTDGSPMVSSQAATVLAAFRHMASIGSVMAPGRYGEIIRNLAYAASTLDASVIMELAGSHDGDRPGEFPIVRELVSAFDDDKVAALLATVLAGEGHASNRLAEVIHALAPDHGRRQRVLSLARSRLSETDFGHGEGFKTVWGAVESLLVSYDETPFVSDDYRAQLDGARERSAMISAAPPPEEMPEWLATVTEDELRHASIALLMDLLALERDAEHATEILKDLSIVAEDAFRSADYEAARSIVRLIADTVAGRPADIAAAAGATLETIARCAPLRQAVKSLGGMDGPQFALFRESVVAIGPVSIESLRMPLLTEEDPRTRERASEMILAFGPSAIKRLAPLLSGVSWFTTVWAAELLGRIGTADAIPLLQSLVRHTDARVIRAATIALARVRDASAVTAIQSALKGSTRELRTAMASALVEARERRVVPILASILADSEPLDRDHSLALDVVTALGRLGDDRAVPALATIMAVRRWFGRARTAALKEAAAQALVRIATPTAAAALSEAGKRGDRQLRRIVRQVGYA